MKKKNTGITLVALVITIIVLIILAGVSINSVMNGGLIDNAKSAKDDFNKGKETERLALTQLELMQAMPSGGKVIKGGTNSSTSGGNNASGSNLSTGVVMQDSNGNEWVWIEVPKAIYKQSEYIDTENGYSVPSSSTDYVNIENALKKYSGYPYTMSDIYNEGLPFENAEEYNKYKNSMLKSVYENGGFWVGRYEAGTQTARSSADDTLTDAVIKQNAYPYNWVTISQAQERAEKLATGGKTSSLMFGLQWQLMLKCIEENGYLVAEDGTITDTKITSNMLSMISDSRVFGNYSNVSFTINRGKYSAADFDSGEMKAWADFNTDDSDSAVVNKVKQSGQYVLLTTGAADRNSMLNIYDIAGNVGELTLTKPIYSLNWAAHGGSFVDEGSGCPSYIWGTASADGGTGFRATLW